MAKDLPERDNDKPSELQGLFRKYEVSRVDGKPEHNDCDYFVLDVTHDPHAKAALCAYADAVEVDNPTLAGEMRSRYCLPTSRHYIKAPAVSMEELEEALAGPSHIPVAGDRAPMEVAIVVSGDDHMATVQWLWNPMPPGTVLYEVQS